MWCCVRLILVLFRQQFVQSQQCIPTQAIAFDPLHRTPAEYTSELAVGDLSHIGKRKGHQIVGRTELRQHDIGHVFIVRTDVLADIAAIYAPPGKRQAGRERAAVLDGEVRQAPARVKTAAAVERTARASGHACAASFTYRLPERQ